MVLTLMLKVKNYLVKVYSSEVVSPYYGDIVLPIHFPVFGPVPPNHFANRLNANVQSCYCCCFSASRERESMPASFSLFFLSYLLLAAK